MVGMMGDLELVLLGVTREINLLKWDKPCGKNDREGSRLNLVLRGNGKCEEIN